MPFQKGESGNPGGRPKGVPDRRTLVRDLLLPNAPALVGKAVEIALAGDTVMLKACLDKLLPNTRERSVVGLASTGSPAARGREVLGQVSSGALPLEDGRVAMGLLSAHAQLEEQDELALRIEALEEASGLA